MYARKEYDHAVSFLLAGDVVFDGGGGGVLVVLSLLNGACGSND